MLAERAKDRDSVNSVKAKLFTEIFIPLFAIMTLIGVTSYFCIEAIKVLYDKERITDTVNIVYLYIFSGINIIVDILCITMFFLRRKDIFIEKKVNLLPQLSLDDSIHSQNSEFGQLHDEDTEDEFYGIAHDNTPTVNDKINRLNNDILIIKDKKNLNMVSAFAHIGGDSLRTVSVLIAAGVSTWTGASIDICDAWGAIAVSALVLLIMVPLIFDLYRACRVLAEEARHEYAELGHGDSDLDEILI